MDMVDTADIKVAPIEVTHSAAKRIKTIVDGEGGGLHLRLSVSGGGCSGFQYGFELGGEREPGDAVVERDGAVVVVDETSLLYVAGARLDFIEDLTGAYFKVDNPNAASGCGCGSSFAI